MTGQGRLFSRKEYRTIVTSLARTTIAVSRRAVYRLTYVIR